MKDSNGSLPAVQSWKSYLTVQRIKNDAGYDLDTSNHCEDKDYPVESAGKNVGAQVPIDCFYYKRSNGACDTLLPKTMPIIGAAVAPKVACVIILVGLQIATRDVDNWTWTTFWWTNKSQAEGTEGRDKTALPRQFQHFAMKTLVSPDVIPRTPGTLTALFNPYLEGPEANGVHSNCLLCHSTAAYKPTCVIGTASCSDNHNGIIAPEKSIGELVKVCDPTKPDRVASHCPSKTNFLWSIATNQDPNSHEPR